ncbi:MAG: hypothetical protein LBJ79_02095 [Endomicrobium sp.]|jgi:hypothetical protein|nr:hypothetical protein [Endomicrobium sp.]
MQDIGSIKSLVATWRSFSPKKSVEDAVIYLCESHNDHHDEKEYVRATIDLVYKDFDLQSCEKYELRTGYLSRWNYKFKNFDEMSEQEVEQAINKGYEEESAWLKRCKPNLTSFKLKEVSPPQKKSKFIYGSWIYGKYNIAAYN